ncbi:mitochondrial import inner membrane translocase subunit Tim10-B, partial [Huso huso]
MDAVKAQQLAAELEVEMMSDMYNRMTGVSQEVVPTGRRSCRGGGLPGPLRLQVPGCSREDGPETDRAVGAGRGADEKHAAAGGGAAV